MLGFPILYLKGHEDHDVPTLAALEPLGFRASGSHWPKTQGKKS